MKKTKLKMKNNLKYLILGVVDLIALLNLPLFMKEVNSINDYRFNMIILFTIFILNAIAIHNIEK